MDDCNLRSALLAEFPGVCQPEVTDETELIICNYKDHPQRIKGILEPLANKHAQVCFLYLSTSKLYNPGYIEEGNWRFKGKASSEETHIPLSKDTDVEMLKTYNCDSFVREYCKSNYIKSAVFRLGCIYGYPLELAEGFMPKAILCCKKKEVFNIYGYGGNQVRDYLHYRDLMTAAKNVLNAPIGFGEIYNIGGGITNSMSVNEVVERIRWFKPLESVYFDEVKDNRPFYATNYEKAARDFTFAPTIQVIDYIKEEINS